MTETTVTGPLVTGGWCIHGVAYGPNWRCAQCGSGNVTVFTSETPRPLDPLLAVRLDRIIQLLEEIAGRRR